MSIKSQKSLNEECSEIIERSYSVRSASEESLSSCSRENWEKLISTLARDPLSALLTLEDSHKNEVHASEAAGKSENEDESLARELMGKLTPAVLSQLRRKFRTGAERSRAADIDRRVEEVMRQAAAEEGIEFARPTQAPEDSLWLDKKGFVTAIEGIFGNHKYTTHAHKLFHLLDPFSTGRVRWRQLVCRLVAVGARKTRSRAEVWTPMQERAITKMDTCKRETIVKLVCIEKEDSFCYAAVTRGGRVALYSGQMKLLLSYEVFYHRTGIQRRVKNCWITDVLYLEDVQCLILSASDRSLTVYDAATLTHTPTYCITGLPSIPTCMAYSPSPHPGGHAELALGTERGDLVRVRFLQPRVSLFYTRSPDHINYYFWMELSAPPHAVYCSHSTWRRVHARSVRRVCFARPHIVLSCSHDSVVSVRARHIDEKLHDYVFAVQRGVSCFHVVPSLQLLATGGCDGAVRLWALTQATPFAVLPTPVQAAVLDVAVVASREIVIAFCSNCWLHIWDLYEECLLQTIKLKFPCLGVLGKKVEFGPYCIHPGIVSISEGHPPLLSTYQPNVEFNLIHNALVQVTGGPARRRHCEEEPSTPDPLPPLISSRRASSVCLGSTGGLMLQDDVAEEPSRHFEDDPEYIRFNRAELLVTCCDYTCTVALCDGAPGALLPAPGDTLRARRPSFWDLPDDVLTAPAAPPTPPARCAPAPQYLSPATAEAPADADLDTLLQNAGLQGLLEKDFVLMQGLRHDLNRKLAEMRADMDCITAAVSRGAPHLALRIAEPLVTPQVNDMLQECKRVMRLFPTVSITGTPAGSETSTPRSRKKGSQLLSG